MAPKLPVEKAIAENERERFRLVLIATFIQVPPSTDYSRGYFACLMDDASNDIDEAGSDIFEQALPLIRDESHRASLRRQRAYTLS
jgi:hypothetical protein